MIVKTMVTCALYIAILYFPVFLRCVTYLCITIYNHIYILIYIYIFTYYIYYTYTCSYIYIYIYICVCVRVVLLCPLHVPSNPAKRNPEPSTHRTYTPTTVSVTKNLIRLK